MRGWCSALAAGGLLVLGCAGAAPPSEARPTMAVDDGAGAVGAPTGARRVAKEPTTPPSNAEALPRDRAAAVIHAAMEEVSARRGLPPKRRVQARWVGRGELLDVVDRLSAEGLPEHAVTGNEALLVGLGVVPIDFDFERSVRALMGEQLAGLYEPGVGIMYMAEDLEDSVREVTLAHELVHALQDQHFDLEQKLGWAPDKSDAAGAIHALAEGDATLAMLSDAARGAQGAGAWMDAAIRMQLETSSDGVGVPAIVARSAAATYSDGILFVAALHARGGWAAVDEAWRAPPVSTEQVLHVEKYYARELPEEVPIPAPATPELGEGTLYHDVIGEQGLRVLLEEWVPRRTAVAAASEWQGDRLAVYELHGVYAIAWRVRYDSWTSAQRGGLAMARGILTVPGRRSSLPEITAEEAQAAWTGGWTCRVRHGLGPMGVALQDRELVVVAGPFEWDGAAVRSSTDCAASRAWALRVLSGELGSVVAPAAE